MEYGILRINMSIIHKNSFFRINSEEAVLSVPGNGCSKSLSIVFCPEMIFANIHSSPSFFIKPCKWQRSASGYSREFFF